MRKSFVCITLLLRFSLQLQGSIMVASMLQILVGFSGLVGFLMRYIGPLTIAPTVTLIGLSLYDPAGNKAGEHWGISAMCVLLPVSLHAFNTNKLCPAKE